MNPHTLFNQIRAVFRTADPLLNRQEGLFDTLAAVETVINAYDETGHIIVISTSKTGGHCQDDITHLIPLDGFIAKISEPDKPRTQYGNEPGRWVCHDCHSNYPFSQRRFPGRTH